jgi:hypothetical protein
MTTREQVMLALVAKIEGMIFSQAINGKTTWVSVSRRLKLWGDVPPDRRPAAFVIEHGEQDLHRQVGTGGVKKLMPRLVCYTNTRDHSAVGGTHLNVILEALETVLKPDVPGRNLLRLGEAGIYYVRIEGEIFKDPGDLDGDSMMVVPLVIEMP